jgi:hypothetical protein
MIRVALLAGALTATTVTYGTDLLTQARRRCEAILTGLKVVGNAKKEIDPKLIKDLLGSLGRAQRSLAKMRPIREEDQPVLTDEQMRERVSAAHLSSTNLKTNGVDRGITTDLVTFWLRQISQEEYYAEFAWLNAAPAKIGERDQNQNMITPGFELFERPRGKFDLVYTYRWGSDYGGPFPSAMSRVSSAQVLTIDAGDSDLPILVNVDSNRERSVVRVTQFRRLNSGLFEPKYTYFEVTRQPLKPM